MFFVQHKPAYGLRSSDWSSYVCSPDLTNSTPWSWWTIRMPSALSARTAAARLSIAASKDGSTSLPARWARHWAAPREALWRRTSPSWSRSDAGLVGHERVSTCTSPWSPYHYKTTSTHYNIQAQL